ncbi:MAG: S-layer homology domain-containing protein [Oscillospiraceae bacterium]|nr:S-layer homology domain-containing protein [Oscillospiraceae bacterium]
MRKKSILHRMLSLMLAMAMILSYLPAKQIHAASNLDGGLEGQTADVFSALGFDTSVLPEGYDAETADNPYGRDKLPGNQIFEMVITGSTINRAGHNNNTLGISDVVHGSESDVIGFDMFTSAAGDFDGDGLEGEVVYVGFEYLNEALEHQTLSMRMYDGSNDTFGDYREMAHRIPSPSYQDPYDYTFEGQVLTLQYQKLLETAAGDFDGDGYDEIAVFIPSSGSVRVDVYKWMRDDSSEPDDWRDLNNWSVIWSHALASSTDTVNMVSLLASDLNRDGVDDLGISYSQAEIQRPLIGGWPVTAEGGGAVILWGDRSNALQTTTALNLMPGSLGEMGRISLTAGDIDLDGYKELVITGEPLDEIGQLTGSTRSIIIYTYDGAEDFVSLYSGNIKVVDGTTQADGAGMATWVSNNGFDSSYYSMSALRTNAAVVRLEGYDYGMLYLDSCLYEYTEGALSLKMSLDDDSYDGTNTLDSQWLGGRQFYAEYGAVAADINGSGYDQLCVSYHTFSSKVGWNEKEVVKPGGIVHSYKEYSRSHYFGMSGLQGTVDGTLIAAARDAEIVGTTPSHEVGVIPEHPEYETSPEPLGFSITAADTDLDTTLIEYTGRHWLSYSDPKLMAVVAAAPYFEDVDIISDYAWQNTTSWSRIEGGGHGTTVQMDVEGGAYVSQGSDYNELEVATLFTMEWVQESAEFTEYTLTFETSQDEDAVAFFSIPTEHYEYIVSIPDGKGGYKTDSQIVFRPFQAVHQVLTLDYYESIRGDYTNLPAIRGEVLTSTPGDPASYPSSAEGYDVIAKWNDEPAGVSFGNGSITQEITVTQEESESYNLGAALDTQTGFGYKNALGGIELMAGLSFSVNPSGGWVDYEITGTTISGTVANMPLEFRDYGYYYDWALFSYALQVGEDTVPIVSYIVDSVSAPPRLPGDFQQDVERTTSDKNVLTWTYDDSYSKFIIYKYFDFPVGGGLEKVAEFEAGETPYTLKYDKKGLPYKEFYFEDTNLAPYSEYQYAIQVERLAEVPPLSAPSGLVTARTKAAVGNPVTCVTESDGTHNGELLVYPDRNAYLTATVTGPDGEDTYDYYSTVQYQWQKKVDGAWEDQINETGRTLAFESSGKSVEGEYRCRINVLTKADNTAISTYTDSVTVKQSKRTSTIVEAYAMDLAGNVKLYAKVGNPHTDSAAVPDGYVTFNFVNTANGNRYPVNVPLDASGVASVISENALPAGQYRVYVTYSGSYVFKSSTCQFHYLAEIESSYAVEALDTVTYGDGTEATFQKITKQGGMTQVEPVDAKEVYLLGKEVKQNFTTESKPEGEPVEGCTPVSPMGMVTKGTKYAYHYSTTDKTLITGEVVRIYNYMLFTATDDGILEVSKVTPVITPFYPFSDLEKGADTGKYIIADETYAGEYDLVFVTDSGEKVISAITVTPRPITLQLPTVVKKQDAAQTMGDITFGELPVASGSWAACDSDADGNITGTIAAASVTPGYTNTAGTAYHMDSPLDVCGYYTISAAAGLDNYRVRFLPGSLSVIGGNKPVTFGVRPFEGKDVGTLYMVSPDYAYTREDRGITMAQTVGSRVLFTAVPDEGYQIYDWYVDGVAQGRTDTSFALVVQNQDTTVEVQFVFKPDTLVFEVAGATEGGTLTCSDRSLTSGSIVVPNTYMTFTAQAIEGYHFKEWRYTELGNGTAYYAEDDGKMRSTFELLMPKTSCSLYAVFERDGYTLTYTDKHGADGLTAWYWGSTTGDTTAQLEKITVASGDSVPGDTEVVIQAREGFELDEEYNFVSTGSQGVADYDKGTYTLILNEDTSVTGYTIRNSFSVTLDFNIETTYAFCEDAKVTLTIDGTERVYDCPGDDNSYTVADIPGGSKVSVAVSYPGYYVFDGWDVNGTVMTAETYTVAELGENTTFTLNLTEKPVHKVTLADISDKGTYTVTLPDGAGQSGNVVTCHENDPLTIQVTPGTGYTVTYWNVASADADNSWETKATSLKYQFPTLTADYTFTPIFSGSTYHTVSWPTLRYYDVTLTSQEGCLTNVISGGDFAFTLSGGEDQYAYVLVNGQMFYSADETDNYPYRYQDEDGVRVYTISNITSNQEITVSMEEPDAGVNINPKEAEVPTGKTITLKAEPYGDVNLNLFTWFVDGDMAQQGASDTYVYEAAERVGKTVTILLLAGNNDNGERYDLETAEMTITITDAVAAIDIASDDLTAAEDGSYRVYPITADGGNGSYDFDALVTMYSGTTTADVDWSLWGAQMRGTSIDENGVLTVSPREYGTGGRLKVIATYTYADGETDNAEAFINLCPDAYVAAEVVGSVHGSISQIGYVSGGTAVTVTAAPDENHEVANWYINGVAVADENSLALSFTAEEMTHYTVSVEFTHYYPEAKYDEASHWYECSCGERTEVEAHYDFDKNHFCDKCGYRMSACADEDRDHFCDWCGKRITECVDAEPKDHICDWCGETLTVCADEDTDHVCDWCGETISECADENNNHFCDVCKKHLSDCADDDCDHNCDICGRTLSDCADGDSDHLCDICSERLSDCADADRDHNCDICNAPISDCADTAPQDHKCDICGKVLSECTDEDSDDLCDICGKELNTHECIDDDGNHACDICGTILSVCADADDNHVCDVCGMELNWHSDENSDHICDAENCGKLLSECADENHDHSCDLCGGMLSECTDADQDHFCDICGGAVSDCTDENSDHRCDVCGKVLTQCVDETPADHLCDICGKDMHECDDENCDHFCDRCGYALTDCVDEDQDHICDICGSESSICADGDNDHCCDICSEKLTDCTDGDDHRCDVCGETVSDCVDADHDDVCDICGGETFLHEDSNCDHRCDVCALPLSECSDTDGDHLCDICGAVWSVCADQDRDHACDICGGQMGVHAPAEGSHICDYCGETVGECSDGNHDHFCDICGRELSLCSDLEPRDHLCDICGKVLSECGDGDRDHMCDHCGAKLTDCDDEDGDHICDHCGGLVSQCTDSDHDHKCDLCGVIISECSDGNDDHLCDICGVVLSECADENCDHRCDVCGARLSDCTDEDHDHKCDICGELMPTYGECPRDDSCILMRFEDVVLSEWYHDGLHYCVEKGIMKGISEKLLAPYANTNRAQLVLMLYRIAGSPSVAGMTEPFMDVAEDDWFYEAIVWAYENNIVKGVSATAFAPGESITREQFAAILYRYAGEPQPAATLEDYPDADSVSGYARDAMAWAIGEGLINGMIQLDGTVTLTPAGKANRAQIATILMRYLTK